MVAGAAGAAVLRAVVAARKRVAVTARLPQTEAPLARARPRKAAIHKLVRRMLYVAVARELAWLEPLAAQDTT